MVHDDAPVRREVDIELEAVRAGGHSDIECRDSVFGTEIAPAPMREDLRSPAEERHNA
jgi:hypothetical protein